MTPTERQVHDAEEHTATAAGMAAAAALREALARVGITLPSVRGSTPLAGTAFVELGGTAAGTATRLAEIVHAAADARPDLRTPTP
ncbi:hypothetical protein AB0M57_14765 [Streptomyces sp. NPDC051597]|uniref:hypothetical protein n=1 Tax=Streptomyces sp. NPDC051597 TaxID=3155049 RepID=UPI0034331A03